VVVLEHSPRSFKSALKRADRMNCRFAVLLGEEEAAAKRFTLKDMGTGRQFALSLEELAARLSQEETP
jgi:histidyl-tRNA synthetase